MIHVTLTDNDVETIFQALEEMKNDKIKTLATIPPADSIESQRLSARVIESINRGITEIETIITKLNNAEGI